MAFLFGTLAGLLTSIMFTKLKIKPLLSGILTMTILYSINLRINGKSNIPYLATVPYDLGLTILILAIIVLSIKVIMDLF